MNEPYVEYMKRMLEESVQYKPKEENTIEKYMNYEVEEERPKSKKKTDWTDVALVALDVAIIGVIIFVLYEVFFGG